MATFNYPEFETYLQSISDKYKCWWNFYTLTDGEYFDFGLMVQEVQAKKKREKQQEEIELLPVLEGIRKYADKHVLLIGKPGSGKSTALQRLLWEDAEAIIQGEKQIIPILVELRNWDTSVETLIYKFLRKNKLRIDQGKIEDLLFDGELLLLMDGLNELPSDKARDNVAQFRRDYSETPMIFSTRDLAVGGNLGIDKQLEMQPLTETQMREFVIAYLPQQSEQMLQQLDNRLWELGETPLILKMLCDVFKLSGEIPENKGELFRQFDSEVNHIKEDKETVPIPEGLRRWKGELLQYLAFEMMQPKNPQANLTDFRLSISRSQTEAILENFLKGRVDFSGKKEWLDGLLKHCLLESKTSESEQVVIEFHHQLFQEYYAAEYFLLHLLPNSSDEKLKRDYLNLLKWTESLALMLGLVEDETQALRVTKLGLDVDLMLGARLAGEVRKEFQEKTVGLVLGLNTTYGIKIDLLGATGSKQAISPLLKAWNSKEYKYYSYDIAETLAYLGDDKPMSSILELEDEHMAIMNEAAQYKDWEYWHLYERIYSELDNITSSNEAIYKLVKLLNDKKFERPKGRILRKGSNYDFCYTKGRNSKVNQFLGGIIFEEVISFLLQALNHEDFRIRYDAACALGNIASETEVITLTKAVKDDNYFVRSSAIDALGKIGSSKATYALIQAINDEKSFVRSRVVKALGLIGSSTAIPALIERLNYEKDFIRIEVTEALEKINDDDAIYALIKLLKDKEPDVRRIAAAALGYKGSYFAVNDLIFVLKDEEVSVSSAAQNALFNICEYLVKDRMRQILIKPDIKHIIKNLDCINFRMDDETEKAAYKLTEMCEKYFIYLLNDSRFFNKYKKISVYLSSNNSLLESEFKYYIWEAMLTQIGVTGRLSEGLIGTIGKIQENCKYYNHEIFHSQPVEEDKSNNSTLPNINNFYAPVDIVNSGDIRIQGNQIGTQNNQKTESKE